MDFTHFKTKWLGHIVDFDHKYNYQCVDLILEYVYESYHIANGVAGNAIDYWNNPSPALLEKFHKVASSEAHIGDIVVLHGQPNNPAGHVGIATGNINANDVEILEQNGSTGNGQGKGKDRIRVRYVQRNRVAGLLRPNEVASVHHEVVHPYTIAHIDPKRVKITHDTHRWGLNYDNFTAIVNSPQADVTKGTILTVNAVLHHNIGYNYYLTDPHVPSGYNVADCADYNPAPPPPKPPKPHESPAGAIFLPNSEKYEVIKEVGGYLTSNMAINHIDERVKIPAGNYFVFNKRFHNDDPKKLWAVNVTKTSGKPGAWIAVDDNADTPPEPEVKETKVKTPEYEKSFKSFDPIVYVAMFDLSVVDVSGAHKSVTMPQYNVTKIGGDFKLDGKEYWRLQSAIEKNMWFAIEKRDSVTNRSNLEIEEEINNAKMVLPEHEASKPVSLQNRWALAFAHGHNFLVGFGTILGKIKIGNKNKKG